MQAEMEVIGLGAGDIDQLPLGIYRRLTEEKQEVFVRTLDHPVISELEQEGVRFQSFDSIYEEEATFEAVYEKIAETLLQKAEERPLLYAVPGHPMLAEQTVQHLLQQEKVKIHILGGQSYLDATFASLRIDPIEGFQFLDATCFRREDLAYRQHLIFCQVYDTFVASNVKLALLEDLPEDYPVTVLEAVGTAQEKKHTVPLEELDRMEGISNLKSVYVPPVPDDLLHHTFGYLRDVIRTLRSPGGCPWDQKQTHDSLRTYLLEESYELIEAIDAEDDEAIIEELGDVLLQVMLHSQIGEDDGYFTVEDVIEGITNKMIHRHPHVFGDGDSDKTWEELKQEERTEDPVKSYLDGIIWQAPSLIVAEKLQKKAAKAGFDWEEAASIWDKFTEEKQEFLEAVTADQTDEAEMEFGDILFVLANLARHYEIDSELALNRANKKFYRRFTEMETAAESGRKLKEMTFEELNILWDEAKRKE